MYPLPRQTEYLNWIMIYQSVFNTFFIIVSSVNVDNQTGANIPFLLVYGALGSRSFPTQPIIDWITASRSPPSGNNRMIIMLLFPAATVLPAPAIIVE